MAWTYLLIAGALEIAWAIGLKYSDNFRKPLASVVTVILMIASFIVLARAMKSLPVGTAYAVWTGIGACGTAILGMYLFKEPATLPRVAFLALIVAGIAGLKYTG